MTLTTGCRGGGGGVGGKFQIDWYITCGLFTFPQITILQPENCPLVLGKIDQI